MRVTLIAAVSRNRVIGREGGLPWRLPADLRHFKRVTFGHTLVMGRKTWESLPGALPGRRTLVLSRADLDVPASVAVVGSLADAIDVAVESGETELFVAGGGGVYEGALVHADRMVLSWIDADFEGDTFFPAFDVDQWQETKREEFLADVENRWSFSIVEYVRI